MTQDILEKYAPIGVEVLKMNVSKVGATGKTSESIHSVVEPDRLLLLARGYFKALETGRGPRESSEYGGFDKSLEEWLAVKFQSKTSKTGNKYYKIGESWVSAKSLAYKINTVGDKLWRQGHGDKVRDVYSDALDKFVAELIQAVKKDQMATLMAGVRESLKFEHGTISS